MDLPSADVEASHGDVLDGCIRAHYFDMPNDSKAKIKKKFVPLSKRNEVQRKCVGVQPDFFQVNESKITAFVKLGIFDDKRKSLLEKIKRFE